MSETVLNGMVLFQEGGHTSEPSTPLASVPAPSEKVPPYSNWGTFRFFIYI